MTAFLIGLIIGIILGAILGSYVAKIGNTPDQVTNVSLRKQVIKDSPGTMIDLFAKEKTPYIEKKRIFGRIFNKLKKQAK